MDKFSLGEVPRTSTGLIPSTFRRKQDTLSTTKNWATLPKQPRPELYPYRGDYINARNRKKIEKKKAKLDATKHNVPSKNINIECSSTIAIPPCSPRQNVIGWNANYKHNAFELTPDEQRKISENKSRFTDFLRVQASERHARANKNKNKTVTKPPQDDTKPKKKKPPVPRLSGLARARAQGKNYTPNKAKSISIRKMSAKSTDKQVGAKNKEGDKYLDFISKKPAKTLGTPMKSTTTLKEPVSSIKQRVFEDDDSIFRLQLERIVRRASDLVIEKEKHTTIKFDSNPSKSSSSFLPTAAEDKENLNANTKKVDMRSRHNRLDELEKRLSRISGSSIISDASAMIMEQPSEDTSLYSGQQLSSIGTEVIPRVPVQMHSHSVPMNQDSQWTNLYDHLHNDSSDSESDTSSSSSLREQTVWQRNENFDACPSLQLSVVQPSTLPTRHFEEDPLPRPRGHDNVSLEVSESLQEDDFFSLFG
eukprot:scaffold10267_cov120-Skeletonema_dohrnii-CCMP3373.AAC.6